VAGEEDAAVAPGESLVGHADKDNCLTPIGTDLKRLRIKTDVHGPER
jgi:hypothetical protein